MSRDIPIIFSAPMVQALLAGRKTMTRRLAWRDARFGLQDYASEQLEDMELRGWVAVKEGDLYRVLKPTSWQKVKPGDRLYVRENFRFIDGGVIRDGAGNQMDVVEPHVIYATDYGTKSGPWKPSIHMPRTYSRLTLEVTAVKVEPLQDISEADAIAEGIYVDAAHGDTFSFGTGDRQWGFQAAEYAYGELWSQLHGHDSWYENPEVVALTFTVHQTNIDSMGKAA